MRQSQDPTTLRLRMALYAKEHGVKPAAAAFKTTPKTVRKWLRRFDGKSPASLNDPAPRSNDHASFRSSPSARSSTPSGRPHASAPSG